MRFYRPLGRISALTFDLDDTLYDNRPVILRTEREALTFVQNYHPALRSFQNEDLQRRAGGTGSGTRDLSRRDALAFSFD